VNAKKKSYTLEQSVNMIMMMVVSIKLINAAKIQQYIPVVMLNAMLQEVVLMAKLVSVIFFHVGKKYSIAQ
jgi:hypothetical protein